MTEAGEPAVDVPWPTARALTVTFDELQIALKNRRCLYVTIAST